MRYLGGLLAACIWLLLVGCSSGGELRPLIAEIQPLYPSNDETSAAESSTTPVAVTPDLLHMTDEMKQFVDTYVTSARTPKQRLRMLHSSLRSSALLDIEYDPAADGTAAEAFERGAANCLSYAHLFVAMARYAGLDANYHMLSLRPEFSRHGNQVALRQHVNVLVKLPRKQEYMIDIDPVSRADVAGRQVISDRVASGLHHNNLAMARLFAGQLEDAYSHAVQALSLSPQTDFLWVNLGAIYSRAEHHQASEQAYHAALAINPGYASAMNNLMVLHERQGNTEQADYWESQIIGHRNRNPYYHAYLGELAAEEGDFEAAREHFLAALKRKQDDAELYYRLGRAYLDLERPAQAIKYLELAVQAAELVAQREEYQALLDQLTGTQLALLH